MLIAFAVQLVASLLVNTAAWGVGMALVLACWLMNAYAAYCLRSWAALAASAAGAALVLVNFCGMQLGWLGDIAVNLFYLLFYLPMQRAFDEKLYAADAPERTLRLGRTWATATLIQRGASMLGFLPYFEGQAALSAQQGSYTILFTVQLAFEVIALIAAVVSYIWMVRYLWRVRKLLPKEGKA